MTTWRIVFLFYAVGHTVVFALTGDWMTLVLGLALLHFAFRPLKKRSEK